MDLQLYFAPGACARVSLIALEEIGVPFEARLVAFMAGDHRKPDYLALNPAGKVPLLIADGIPLAQNTAILHFLAKQFPAANLLPPGADIMADARNIARLSWFSADLHPLVTRIRMPGFFCDLPGAAEQVRAKASVTMTQQLQSAEAALSADPWLLGQQWSVLDAYLYWVWFRITGAGFDATAFPAISDHHARMNERPAVHRALATEATAQAELDTRGLAVPLPGSGRKP